MLKYGEGMPACAGLRAGRCRGWVLRAGLPVRAGGDRCLPPVVRRVGVSNAEGQGHFTGNTGPAPIRTRAM